MAEEISVTKEIDSDISEKRDQNLVFSKGQVILSRYKILEKIGSGGFGVVYKASDSVLDKAVALKFLDPEYIDSRKKFHRVKREINISRKITDKRVVKIFSLEEYQGIYFLVMEYLEGISLKDKINKGGVMEWPEFRPVFINIMKGVKALHDHGIIHRDLKPSNIMLVGKDEIKILDFGMSKELDDLEKTSSIGELIGSPHYMSPEQVNSGEIDKRTDVYQLGLILYRVLSGQLPFGDSGSTFEIVFKRVLEKPDRLDRKSLKIPKYTEFGMFKAIEKKAANRFDSIDTMISFFEHKEFILKKTSHFFRKFKWRILLFSAFILMVIYSVLFWVSDNVVSSVDYTQSEVNTYNSLGIGLWEKNFSPYTVNTSFILDNNLGVESNTNRSNFSVDSKKIVTLLNNHEEIDNASIVSGEYDNKVSILTNEGVELDKIGFHKFFNLGRYDFFKKFYVSKFVSNDIDGDGGLERILFIRHFMDMYPTAFIFIKDSNIYGFSNPGTISDFVFLNSDGGNTRILISGVNNIVSHLFFIAEVRFPEKGNFLAKQTSIPNLKQSNMFLPEFLTFIPHFSSYDHLKWDKSGIIELKEYWSGNSITLTKDYKMTITDGRAVRRYSDKKETLYKIYKLINQYFIEKLINKNFESAGELISESLKLNPKNPYLRSALLHFSGDLEIERGYLQQGKINLNKSLENFKYNRDAAQRLCETFFLDGDPLYAYKLVNEKFGHINQFWGLRAGKEIFKSYCMLQLGNFSEAEEIFSLSVFKSNLTDSNTFQAILKLFTGDYIESLKILMIPDSNRIFTIAERRLLCGRAMVLAEQDHQKAEFYFNDLSLNSISYSGLAKMSNYYLKVIRGVKDFPSEQISRDFNQLNKLSRGNFQARLWLFYDAFIYGKTMELLENRGEAIRGYELCIRSNPYTDLANRARERIKNL